MLARRFCVPAVTASMSAMATRRFKTTTQEEDDRWLEAVFDEHTKEMTNEERYAAQKQRDVMKKMLGKVRSQTEEKVQAVEDKHAKEIKDLKDRLASLEKK